MLFAERGERRDFSDEFRPQRPGQVMAHAGESHEAGVRDGSGDRKASARRDERIMETVDDQGRDRDAAQLRRAVRLGRAGCELAARAGRIVPAVPAPAG